MGSSDAHLGVRRVGRVVTVCYLFNDIGFWSGDANDYINIGKVPKGLRPAKDCRTFAFAEGQAVEYMYVGADGNIGFHNCGSGGFVTQRSWGAVITYVAA